MLYTSLSSMLFRSVLQAALCLMLHPFFFLELSSMRSSASISFCFSVILWLSFFGEFSFPSIPLSSCKTYIFSFFFSRL